MGPVNSPLILWLKSENWKRLQKLKKKLKNVKIQLLQYTILPLHPLTKNPDGDISETKRDTTDLLASKGPGKTYKKSP